MLSARALLLALVTLGALVGGAGTASAQFATLHRDTQLGGTPLHVHGDMPRLSMQGFNDSASSITLLTDQPIAVYKDADFSGSCLTIRGTVKRLSDTGFGNDNISSVRVAWTCEGGAYNPDACARAGCGAFSTCTDLPRPASSGPTGRTCSAPTRVNIAPTGVARQSSTGWGGLAPRAIDGNLDGNYWGNSISHTAGEANAWFELDLRTPRLIDTIAVANRTDCCGERMNNAYVQLSSVPCDASPRAVVAAATPFAIAPLQTRTFPGGTRARYVCVRQPGPYIQLTELQVFEPPEIDACTTAPCAAGATCADVPGGDPTAAGRTCELDACLTTACGYNTSCQDKPGDDATAAGRACSCLAGFAGDPATGCAWVPPATPPAPNRIVNTVVVYDAEAATVLGADPVGALDAAVGLASTFLGAAGTATDRVALTLGGALSWDRVAPSGMAWPAPSADGNLDATRVIQAFVTWSKDNADRLDGLAAGNADAVVLVTGKRVSTQGIGVVGSMCSDSARSVVQVTSATSRVGLASLLARQLALNLGVTPEPDGWSLMSWWGVTTRGAIAMSATGRLAFTWIPGATFTMGSPTRELGRTADEVERAVTVSQGLWLQDSEVTRGQWAEIMGAAAPASSCASDDCPVERVSHWDALAFANRLSRAEGLVECYALTGCTGVVGVDLQCQGIVVNGTSGSPLGCTGYRLPTEAEWELAYRAGTRTAFYNGGIATPACADPNAKAIGWHCATQTGLGAKPVKGLLGNALGLYDLAGNVAEWVWDRHGTWTSAAVTDPLGPSASGASRVTRGGGWSSQASALRAASRVGVAATTRADGVGLRLAISTPTAFPQLTLSAVAKALLAQWFVTTYQAGGARCLDDAPPPRPTGARCGDGRIEGDEACDPGIGVADACCTALCDLAPGCVCANTEPCCTAGAFTPASANKICRPASGACDLADTCDGSGGACPVDACKSPGTACASGVCLEAQCVSGPAECQRLGGSYAIGASGTASERYCQELMCTSGGGGYFVGVVPDGLTCGDGMQCLDGACVASSTLKEHRWKVGGWGACVNARRARSVTCVDEAGATAAASACAAAPQPEAQEDCVVDIPPPSPGVTATATLSSSWISGFCMDVRVHNGGAGSVTWAVTQTIAAPGYLTQVWDAKASGTKGVITFTGGKKNKTLKAGAQTTFGYCAKR